MLASLLVQRGSEPPDLPRLALDARAELADRIGGPAVLEDAMQREGIEESELLAFLRDQVRATWYVDKAITPVIAVTEDSLREAYRSTLHPFRNQKFEDARVRLRRWLVAERMRAAELEFLQSARTRIKIATVLPASRSMSAPDSRKVVIAALAGNMAIADVQVRRGVHVRLDGDARRGGAQRSPTPGTRRFSSWACASRCGPPTTAFPSAARARSTSGRSSSR